MLISMTVILVIAAVLAFYLAWNIGANDVANSMSSAVGAKAITLKQAVIIAAILEFTGAVFIGRHVTDTVKKGIINVSALTPDAIILGMLSAILVAAVWVTLATWKEMPVSTTHSIIGSLIGFGIIAAGPSSVHWFTLGMVVLSWIISPLLGAILAYLVFKIIIVVIFNRDDPLKAAKYSSGFFVAATFFIISVSLLIKTPLGDYLGDMGIKLTVADAILYSAVIAIITGIIGHYIIVRGIESGKKHYKDVEAIFRRLQIMTSCYVALAHGANDVANAVGPLAAIYSLAHGISLAAHVEVPTKLMFIGGLGISVGVMTWGYKVIRTVGSRITDLTNTRGFSVDFGTATTVLLASKMGLPISTSHTVVGAVIGVGLARGLSGVNIKVIKDIVIAWLVTVPIAALVTAALYYVLVFILL